MNQIVIESFPRYIAHIEENYGREHLFRGLKKQSYDLVPKIGRKEYTSKCTADPDKRLYGLQDLEERTMRDFIKMSVPHMDLRDMSPWDQWTTGQHYGIPTRFLDWTENPLIAAYFATENIPQNDVVIYVTDRTQFNSKTEELGDVFSFTDDDNVLLHVPSYINARIIAQKGVFTVHRDPTLPLDQTEINGVPCKVDQLIIPQKAVRGFANNLDWFGINRSFIYPGLDGLAHYLDLRAKGGVDSVRTYFKEPNG